jgi:hypothetical protein
MVVTPKFVDHVIRSGRLTEARRRAEDGSARPRKMASWDRFSSWALICEEVLDTEHPTDWYDGILAELRRRGFSFEQIDSMRRFAWETAGWLNYDKMLWDWCSLDEKDIKTALDWQLRDGIITRQRYDERLSFLEHPACIPESSPQMSRTLASRLWAFIAHWRGPGC